ncbi:MAG: prephenate dehydrogenase [Clostridia bacterium]|nr:prephenate dehydrogenase [Clostridia bacterium]
MTVGIVGLGLIGGSLCKAYKENAPQTRVLGWDLDPKITGIAQIAGVIDGELTDERLGECDLVLVAIYPQAAIDWILKKAPLFNKEGVVMDCCGVKKKVCDACFEAARREGFLFVGGHPMAGSHNAGFKYSRGDLYKGAPMVIVPPHFDDIDLLERIKRLLLPVGFGKISVTSAEHHDEVIAFTSQMAHVVSNAYVKSPTAENHKGFSAGSYKDLTRVAWLSAPMWSELFMENKDCLLKELTLFRDNVNAYIEALEEEDGEKLCALLKEGSDIKGRIDGR